MMAQKRICVDSMNFEISYILSRKSEDLPWALFLHGWGANKELMQGAFGNFFASYNHIYIDLPGFGNSDNRYILRTTNYAKIVESFCKELGISPKIIVAHSFGGKIAALLNPSILVLLSSAGIKKIKSFKVKIKIALAKILKTCHIKARIFRSKDAQNLPENMYETFKLVVDEDFSDIFAKFCGKTFIFWGKNDNITPLYMAEKIHSLIKDSKLFVLDGEHFFFLEHKQNAKTIDRIVNGN